MASDPVYIITPFLSKSIAKLTGAKEDEVAEINQLTVKLNLMLISFYRPQGKRT